MRHACRVCRFRDRTPDWSSARSAESEERRASKIRVQNDAGRVNDGTQRWREQPNQSLPDLVHDLRVQIAAPFAQRFPSFIKNGASGIAKQSVRKVEVFQLAQDLIDRRKSA